MSEIRTKNKKKKQKPTTHTLYEQLESHRFRKSLDFQNQSLVIYIQCIEFTITSNSYKLHYLFFSSLELRKYFSLFVPRDWSEHTCTKNTI